MQIEEEIGRRLRDLGLRLATAESCTGGLLGHRITNVSGSSDYFERGIISYSNRAKQELLGVPGGVLLQHGAVSEPTVRAMAEGVRLRSRVDIGIGITGIAGPTGGTPEKPVGLVYIALATSDGTLCEENRFRGEREEIKAQSAQRALEVLLRYLKGKSEGSR